MESGDFFANEKSSVITGAQAGDATIEFDKIDFKRLFTFIRR